MGRIIRAQPDWPIEMPDSNVKSIKIALTLHVIELRAFDPNCDGKLSTLLEDISFSIKIVDRIQTAS